jgi:D-arabinose 1-dehydrogenase-like Zn-dependent alcohol dehydrogenase
VLAAGTGFTDSFIRRGRYPDFKGPLPFTPGYEIVRIVEKTGPGVAAPREAELVADLCVVGGYTQYAIRPADWLVRVPEGVDPAEPPSNLLRPIRRGTRRAGLYVPATLHRRRGAAGLFGSIFQKSSVS